MTSYRIASIGGDGVGPEVIAAARLVLDAVAARDGFAIEWLDVVAGGAASDAYGPALSVLGYQHHPDDDDHEFFDRRPYHVHVCQAGGAWSRRHLAFRDLLRRDPATRLAYEVEKRRLAAMFDDVEQYAKAKTPFIRRMQPREADWPR